MEDLTSKQKETYDFIKKYIENNGYSPSVREISCIFDKSVGTVHPMLKKLKSKGYIDYVSGKARTIKILK